MEAPTPAWWPDDATRERAHLTSAMSELGIKTYAELHRWSVENRAAFWAHVIERLGIAFDRKPDRILDLANGVTDPGWLSGARLNISESCFRAAPERAAILFGREETPAIEAMSYGELERRVKRFAADLGRRGFEPDDAIVLYMPMTPACVIAYLGAVRAGCRVVSVADSFSAEELGTRMDIAGARAVVTVSRYRRAGREIDLYSKVERALDTRDAEAILVDAEPTEERESGVHVADADHITNVLFSSGTTGTPKAIPWSQLAPIKCAMDAHFHQDVHPEDVVCWPTNIGWMMGPWLLYASFLNRATMALYEGAPAGEGFARFVRDAKVTVLGVVPSMVRNWRSSNVLGPGDWNGIRLFSSTGEASSPDDYLWLMGLAGNRAPVIEYLGGTEIGGGHITGCVLQPQSPATFTTPALGIDFLILDESGRAVREGESGELFLVPPSLGMSQLLLNDDHDRVYYRGRTSGSVSRVLVM